MQDPISAGVSPQSLAVNYYGAIEAPVLPGFELREIVDPLLAVDGSIIVKARSEPPQVIPMPCKSIAGGCC